MLKYFIIPALLLTLSTSSKAVDPDFISAPDNAEMLVVTHQSLLTPSWSPGETGAWETDFLSVKSAQGIDVYLHAIGDRVDKDSLKDWIDENCDETLRYILIIGDAHHHPDMYPFYSPDWDGDVPVWVESDDAVGTFVPVWGEVVEMDVITPEKVLIQSDDGYGSSFAGCKVGRLPAETQVEIEAYMAKCVDYYALNEPAWAKNVMFFQNDRIDAPSDYNGNTFGLWLQEEFENTLNSGIDVRHFRYSENAEDQGSNGHELVRQDSLETIINAGMGVIAFTGNGSAPDNLCEMHYGQADPSESNGFVDFTNSGKFPFFIGASSELGAFDYWNPSTDAVERTCIIEKLLFLEDAGIIGAIAPTSWLSKDQCYAMALISNELIFRSSQYEFGETHNTLKSELASGLTGSPVAAIIDQLELLGDPSLTLPYAPFPEGQWNQANIWLDSDLHIANGDTLVIAPGVNVHLAADVDLIVDAGGSLLAEGTIENPIVFSASSGSNWGSIQFASSSTNKSKIKHVDISGADKGIYLVSQSGSSNRLTIDSSSISNCDYGVYLSNAYVNVKQTTVEDCSYSGIYISSCSAGKILLDRNTIRHNGVGNLYDGVTISSSAPEIIRCEITENEWSGIYCGASSPDLNTYSGGSRANTIHFNGIGHSSGDQNGNAGAEIYLSSTSTPTVKYNNIHDVYQGQNWGAMIARYYSSSVLNAEHNYWGSVGVDSTDFWWYASPTKYFLQVFDISPTESSQLSDISDFELAEQLWDEGDFAGALEHFNASITESGGIGINSIHYLTGCYLQTGGDLNQLRSRLFDVAESTEDHELAITAERFATNCLTELHDFQAAADEYLARSESAACQFDSILAVINYLEVCEAGEIDNQIASLTETPKQIRELQKLLHSAKQNSGPAIPSDFILFTAYPNPFNSTVNIRFGLPLTIDVRLKVFDISGREVATFSNGKLLAGYHTVTFNAGNLPSGMYLYRLETSSFSKTMKMTLTK